MHSRLLRAASRTRKIPGKIDAERHSVQLLDKQRCPDRRYSAIEEAEVGIENVWPRISALKSEVDELRESLAMTDMVEFNGPLTKQHVFE